MGEKRRRGGAHAVQQDAPADCTDFWEPFLSIKPKPLLSFVSLSQCCAVSRGWRKSLLEHLRTLPILSFGKRGVTDADVLRSLGRVASENLREVDLSGCREIRASGMEIILRKCAETCSGLLEVNITACSEEAILRAVAIRAQAACNAASALELYLTLRSSSASRDQPPAKERCPMSNLRSLLNSTRPLLLLDDDVQFAPDENALFRAAARGSDVDVALLLTVSFSVGGAVRVYEVEEKDSEGNAVLLTACGAGNCELAKFLVDAGAKVNSANKRDDTPLLVACGAGKLELAEMLIAAGAEVKSANRQGDTPLLAAFGAGKLELAEMLVSKGANVKAVRRDGAGLLSLAIVLQQSEMLKFALTRGPERLRHQDSMSDCDLTKALAESYFDPLRIEAWLRTGASPLGLAGEVGALMTSCALESSTKNRLEDVRAFIFHNLDMLQDPSKWPVKHTVQQLASQEADAVFGENADCDKAAGESRFITLINKREKHLCRSIHRAQSGVYAVCYSPDGSKLARAEGSEVVVCDASTGFVQKTLTGLGFRVYKNRVNAVTWSPDGKSLASAIDDSVRIWDASTGQCVSTLSGHSRRVWSVAWSPDGKNIASGSFDKTIKVWNAQTGQCVLTLRWPSESVISVAWSPDGKNIASGSSDKTIEVWNAQTGQCVSTLSGHSGWVFSVSWSPDGASLASGSRDNTVKIWNTKTGKCDSTLSGHSRCVNAVQWSPDGQSLASASDDETVRIWDASTGQCVSTLTGHSRGVNAVQWSPDGKYLASASNDNTVRIWDASTQQCVSTLSGHSWTSVSWNNDGTKLATGSYDKTIKIWAVGSAGTFECQSTLSGHSDWVRSVVWSPDGTKIASGSDDKTVKMWNAQTGQCVSTWAHSGPVQQVEFTHDGATLVSGGGDTIRYWDVQSGEAKEGKAGEEAKRVLEGSMFTFSKGSSRGQKVGNFLITAEGDILRIFKSEGGVTDKADKDRAPVAFYRAPAPICTVDTSGEHIAVGCQNGEVLQLWAAVLLTG